MKFQQKQIHLKADQTKISYKRNGLPEFNFGQNWLFKGVFDSHLSSSFIHDFKKFYWLCVRTVGIFQSSFFDCFHTCKNFVFVAGNGLRGFVFRNQFSLAVIYWKNFRAVNVFDYYVALSSADDSFRSLMACVPEQVTAIFPSA